jgi:hypothetical protein
MGRSFILDIESVENAVGRVQTTGVDRAGEWVFVDRSGGMCRTTFHNGELRNPDDEDNVE